MVLLGDIFKALFIWGTTAPPDIYNRRIRGRYIKADNIILKLAFLKMVSDFSMGNKELKGKTLKREECI